MLNEDQMATEKLSEGNKIRKFLRYFFNFQEYYLKKFFIHFFTGIRKFAADQVKMDNMVRARILS